MSHGIERAELRELAVRRRLLAVLGLMIDAAKCGSFRSIGINDRGGIDVNTIGVAGDGSAATAEEAAAIESDSAIITALRGAIDKLDETHDELLRAAVDLDSIGTWLPGGVDEAVRNVIITQEAYAAAALRYTHALAEWHAHDSTSSRVRVQCTEQLMQPTKHSEMNVTPGLSFSAADKAASNHPRYMAHKDRGVELSLIKDEAEADRDVAKLRANNSRALLYAMLQARDALRMQYTGPDGTGAAFHLPASVFKSGAPAPACGHLTLHADCPTCVAERENVPSDRMHCALCQHVYGDGETAAEHLRTDHPTISRVLGT